MLQRSQVENVLICKIGILGKILRKRKIKTVQDFSLFFHTLKYVYVLSKCIK